MSGLPEIARGSWNNAAIIAGLNGVGTHPTDTRSRSVISLSGPNLYTVVGNRCTCKNFKAQNICAHSIAQSRGELVQYRSTIVATRHRQYRKPRSGKITFTAKPERVFFHLNVTYCCRAENVLVTSDKLDIPDKLEIQECHLLKDLKEFTLDCCFASEEIWMSTVKGGGALRAPLTSKI